MVDFYDAFIGTEECQVVKREDYECLLKDFERVTTALKAEQTKNKMKDLKDFVSNGTELKKMQDKVDHYKSFNEQLTIRNYDLEITVKVLAGMVGEDSV